MNTHGHPKAGATTRVRRLVAALRDSRCHCSVVLAANAGLAFYSASEPFTGALVLHLVLLPFNAWRLLQASCRASPGDRPTRTTSKNGVVETRTHAMSMWYPTPGNSAQMPTVRLGLRGD